MKNQYILAIIAAGAISVSATLGYSIKRVCSSFNEMHQSLDRTYNCFVVDLPKVGKDLRELNGNFQKLDARAARIGGVLEQLENQTGEDFKRAIQILDNL